MFEIMKRLRKDRELEEGVNLAKIDIGCSIRFGELPHTNISGAKMTVKSVGSYLFGDEVFLAYRLDNRKENINLILTKADSASPYSLSLSKVIEEQWFKGLFPVLHPEKWFSMKEGDGISASNRVMGMQQSWLATDYTMAIKRKGIFMEGNYLRNRKLYTVNPSHNFDYVLFTDEKNRHALEAEKYSDGTLIVYSTIYRYENDILEINESAGELVKEKNIKLKLSYGQQDTYSDNHEDENRTADIIAIRTPGEADSLLQEGGDVAEGVIALDMKMAEKVINEAQRNKMSIGQLVRRVIDLPADVKDEMMISFSLSDSERKELARRYNLSSSDYSAVKQEIVRELQQFFGHKQ